MLGYLFVRCSHSKLITTLENRSLTNWVLEERVLEKEVLEERVLEDGILRNGVLEDWVLKGWVLEKEVLEERVLEDGILRNGILEHWVLKGWVLGDQAHIARALHDRKLLLDLLPSVRLEPSLHSALRTRALEERAPKGSALVEKVLEVRALGDGTLGNLLVQPITLLSTVSMSSLDPLVPSLDRALVDEALWNLLSLILDPHGGKVLLELVAPVTLIPSLNRALVDEAQMKLMLWSLYPHRRKILLELLAPVTLVPSLPLWSLDPHRGKMLLPPIILVPKLLWSSPDPHGVKVLLPSVTLVPSPDRAFVNEALQNLLLWSLDPHGGKLLLELVTPATLVPNLDRALQIGPILPLYSVSTSILPLVSSLLTREGTTVLVHWRGHLEPMAVQKLEVIQVLLVLLRN